MIKPFNTLLITILLSLAIMSNAQNYVDLFKVDYATTPANKFDSSATNTVLQEMNGDLTVPLTINENFVVLTGVAYEMSNASFNPGRAYETFTGLTLKLGANIKHNSNWSGTYLLLPKISSDFKKVASRDFQFGGAVLMKHEKTDHFNYKFGMYANSDIFGPFIVPIFGFYYLNPTDKFEAKVLLPLALDFNYKVSKNARFGINFKGQIRSYNVNTPIGMETNRYLVKSSNDLYTYFQYDIKNGFNIQLGFGRALGRSYRMYDETVSFGMPLVYFGDDRSQLNTDFSDSWLFKASLFYRLDLNKTATKKELN